MSTRIPNTRQSLVDALAAREIPGPYNGWRVAHNTAVQDWHRAQVGYVTSTPRPAEHAILHLAHGIHAFAAITPDNASDGYGGPNVLLPMLAAFRDALNFDLGRLDGGTLDRWAYEVARTHGWDLDTGNPLPEEDAA